MSDLSQAAALLVAAMLSACGAAPVTDDQKVAPQTPAAPDRDERNDDLIAPPDLVLDFYWEVTYTTSCPWGGSAVIRPQKENDFVQWVTISR